jgi:hypothetical protein
MVVAVWEVEAQSTSEHWVRSSGRETLFAGVEDGGAIKNWPWLDGGQ